ncbi:MAG TPA: hypothetical protein VFX16_35685 [Pseudonocardiaceae bacterium]|nr:hypothetical protein [Pseudonocardiaceae bacterium]
MQDRDDGRHRDDDRHRDPRPDIRELRERAARLRADEGIYGGHTFRTHVDVGPAETHARALRDFDKRPGRHQPATRWTSEQALARAVDSVERSRRYRTKIVSAEADLRRGEPMQTVRPVVRIPLRDALGPDWRSGVAGHRADAGGVRPIRFTDSAEVVVVYRARPGGIWRLHTCYPLATDRA